MNITAVGLNGVWNSWTAWSESTLFCGKGSRTRTRSCTPASYCNLGCPGSSTQSQLCQGCEAGTIFAAGSGCTICSPGSYSYSNASKCFNCDLGKFSHSPGSTACTACLAGTYSSVGASACSSCAPGSYSAVEAGSCIICKSGKYSNDVTIPCQSCSPGSFSAVSYATACTACGPNTFANEAGLTACKPVQQCGNPLLYFEQSPPTPISDRVCGTYDIAPVFSSASYAFTISQSLSMGQTIQQVSATTSQGPYLLRYSIIRSLANFVGIDPATGVLYVTSTISSAQEQYVLLVEVQDNRTSCFLVGTAGPVVGGCTAQASVTLSVAFFINCPSDQFIYLSDGSTSAFVTWQIPTLNDVGQSLFLRGSLNISNTSYPGDLFSLGTSVVRILMHAFNFLILSISYPIFVHTFGTSFVAIFQAIPYFNFGF